MELKRQLSSSCTMLRIGMDRALIRILPVSAVYFSSEMSSSLVRELTFFKHLVLDSLASAIINWWITQNAKEQTTKKTYFFLTEIVFPLSVHWKSHLGVITVIFYKSARCFCWASCLQICLVFVKIFMCLNLEPFFLFFMVTVFSIYIYIFNFYQSVLVMILWCWFTHS